MTPRRSGRVQLIGVCEGELDKRFLEALARRSGIEAKIDAAPKGQGSGAIPSTCDDNGRCRPACVSA